MIPIVTDKRHTPRTRRRLLVRFETTSAFTVDVGAGGFSLGMMKVLPAGQAVEGWVAVDGTQFLFSGRVAWSVPGYRHMNLPGKIGVSFTRNDAELSRLFEPTASPLRLAQG